MDDQTLRSLLSPSSLVFRSEERDLRSVAELEKRIARVADGRGWSEESGI